MARLGPVSAASIRAFITAYGRNADDIAAIALYLCADESSFVTGNDYPIDGGFIKLNS